MSQDGMSGGCLHTEVMPKKPPNVVCFAFYRARQEMMRTHAGACDLAHSQALQPLPVVIASTWHDARSSAVSKARPQCSDR